MVIYYSRIIYCSRIIYYSRVIVWLYTMDHGKYWGL
jgi:hypothetical protein